LKSILNIVFCSFLSAAALVLFSCNKDDGVSNGGQQTELSYAKIFTVQSGAVKFEVYSASGSGMIYGYNDIGFKVFINGNEVNSGSVRFRPMMYHNIGGPGHSSPVSSEYLYSSEYNLFKGYVCFTMISDSSAMWFADYVYNDLYAVDSAFFTVTAVSGMQLAYWDDVNHGGTYCLTLIKPLTVSAGLNPFTCILHRTTDDVHFTEIDSASMIIKTYFEQSGEISQNNINPAWKGGGIYTGSVNLTKAGKWHVLDTIYHNNTRITKNSPPDFVFTVQ